jgi:hypothetical protein
MNTNNFERVTLTDVSPNGKEFEYSVKYFDNCEICQSAKDKGVMPFISHNNCVYFDNPRFALGHKQKDGHCTADSCY